MNSLAAEILIPRAQRVAVSDDTLSVDLVDGRTISVPTAWYPRLARAPQPQRLLERAAVVRANVEPKGAPPQWRPQLLALQLGRVLGLRIERFLDQYAAASFLELDLDFAEPDLTGERMRAAETALSRIAEREQKALVAAREILQS